MVEFVDGATIAQLSMPDMRLPIGLALGAPARLARGRSAPIDWTTLGTLTFEPPDLRRRSRASPSPTRPAGPAARRPAVLSGANEVAVEAFLAGRIPWPAIAEIVAEVLERGHRERR